MRFIYVSSEAGDHAPGVVLPIWCVETRECGDEVHSAVVFNRSRQGFNLWAALDQAQIVAYPLHQRSGDGNASFKSVMWRLCSQPVGDGSEQSTGGLDRTFSSVHQKKATRPIRVLGLSRIEAGLAYQRGLLIPQNSRDCDSARSTAFHYPINLGARADARQHRFRNAECVQQFLVPGQSIEVHELGAAGVGDVGNVQSGIRSACEMPNQK